MLRTRFTLTCLLVLSGCASSAGVDSLPASHPASPDAPEAPAALRSETLSLGSGDGPTRPTATPDGAGHDRHDSHEGSEGEAAKPQAAHDDAAPGAASGASSTYTCPHHPEVISDEPGKCPKCRMTLEKKG